MSSESIIKRKSVTEKFEEGVWVVYSQRKGMMDSRHTCPFCKRRLLKGEENFRMFRWLGKKVEMRYAHRDCLPEETRRILSWKNQKEVLRRTKAIKEKLGKEISYPTP